MEAEDAIEARDESDRQLKALSEECSNLKIKGRVSKSRLSRKITRLSKRFLDQIVA